MIGTSSKNRGFIATAFFSLPNRPGPPVYYLHPLPLPPQATIFWIIVQQRTPQDPALLTCPPLMCGADEGPGRSFLTVYISYKQTLAR